MNPAEIFASKVKKTDSPPEENFCASKQSIKCRLCQMPPAPAVYGCDGEDVAWTRRFNKYQLYWRRGGDVEYGNARKDNMIVQPGAL